MVLTLLEWSKSIVQTTYNKVTVIMPRSLPLKLAVLASFSLLAAACGDDEKAGDACDSSFVASCDKNATLTCENGQITKTDCGDKSCEAGVCVVPGTVGCGPDYAASCKANTALTCENAVVIETDCGDKVCENGVCVDKTIAECDASHTAICVINAIQTCVNGKLVSTECGAEVCENGVCVDLMITECAAGYAPSCDGNATLTCVENVITKTDCAATAVCTDGACVVPDKPKQGNACTVSACDGNDVYHCYSKKYSAAETCTTAKACSVDKDGYGSCVTTCTEAKKGDMIKVCEVVGGTPYIISYVCGLDALGNYVYDDDIDNTPYEDCLGACIDGQCML